MTSNISPHWCKTSVLITVFQLVVRTLSLMLIFSTLLKHKAKQCRLASAKWASVGPLLGYSWNLLKVNPDWNTAALFLMPSCLFHTPSVLMSFSCRCFVRSSVHEQRSPNRNKMKAWFLNNEMFKPVLPVLCSSSRLIYYLDPSVLTGLSCTVMLLCLADYLVPTLAPRVFGSNKWWELCHICFAPM